MCRAIMAWTVGITKAPMPRRNAPPGCPDGALVSTRKGEAETPAPQPPPVVSTRKGEAETPARPLPS